MSDLVKIPTLQELVAETETTLADNALTVILNQNPPDKWLSQHPIAKIKNAEGKDVPLPYLPINKIEYLLTKIFGKWWVEVRSVLPIANSVTVTVRLYVVNPITKETQWNDGVGAAPIQTDKGAGAMDWNAAKSTGVQIALPAAETYAIKDAAEKFGKIFGKDLGRKESMDYTALLKKSDEISLDELRELLDKKSDKLSVTELKDAKRIVNNNEVLSFKKLHKKLLEL